MTNQDKPYEGRISKNDLFDIHNSLKVASSRIANLIHYLAPKEPSAYEYGQILDIANTIYDAMQRTNTWYTLNEIEDYMNKEKE